jgi:hypothetical protein
MEFSVSHLLQQLILPVHVQVAEAGKRRDFSTMDFVSNPRVQSQLGS